MLEVNKSKSNITKIIDVIRSNKIRYLDYRFTDLLGKQRHVTIPVDKDNISSSLRMQAFDGSSIPGWKGVEKSDMLLCPDTESYFINPFFKDTISIICNVLDSNGNRYESDPRYIAFKAKQFLIDSGLGDKAYFGPEPEFFIFDDARWHTSIEGCMYKIKSSNAAWDDEDEHSSYVGHKPRIGGGYLSSTPMDALHNIRTSISETLEFIGIPVEVHHYEVATAGQCEIGTRYNDIVIRADWTQSFKYVVMNIADQYNKVATFMPKPLVGDNGSGMHVHQSIWKDGVNLFYGDKYSNISQLGLYYIGGIMRHIRALNALANPSTNSYKRLVPGFEAPTKIAYASCNRSAAIRIPLFLNKSGARIEARFPDPLANSYLLFSALLMAGLDGIKNKISPGDAADFNLYLDSETACMCNDLNESIRNLIEDSDFLLEGGVFTENTIKSYTDIKLKEINRLRVSTHPIEFEMYFSG